MFRFLVYLAVLSSLILIIILAVVFVPKLKQGGAHCAYDWDFFACAVKRVD